MLAKQMKNSEIRVPNVLAIFEKKLKKTVTSLKITTSNTGPNKSEHERLISQKFRAFLIEALIL